VCCTEFVGYQGTANDSCICEGSSRPAIVVDSEFECLEWPILGRAYSCLVGPDGGASI